MAKLHARGREEIYRVEKWIVRDPTHPYDRFKKTKALMDDGTILVKTDASGWVVHGKIKPGINAEQALKINLDAGYTIVNLSFRHFDRKGDTITGRSDKPLVTEAKAASKKRAAAKRSEKAKAERETKNGPGFYVTNAYMGLGSMKTRIADHEKPFETYEQAEEFAWRKLREFIGFKFTYLLPVIVIEAATRDDVEVPGYLTEVTEPYGKGYVWWINGKFKGPPVDPRQTALFT